LLEQITSTFEFIAGKFNFDDSNTEGNFSIRGVVDTTNIDVTTNANISFVGSVQTIREQVYDNMVYLDVSSTSGSTSTNKYPFGTVGQPVNNLADAIDICEEYNIKTIMVGGTLVLDEDVSGLHFVSWKNGKIDLNNQSATSIRFTNLKVYGQQNTIGLFYDCRIDGLTNMKGVYDGCKFLGHTGATFSDGVTEMINCSTQSAGVTQEFGFSSGGGTISSLNFTGKIKFKNSSNPGTLCNFSHITSMVELDSTISAGVFVNIGTFNMTDNKTGIAVAITQPVAMQQNTNNMIIGNS